MRGKVPRACAKESLSICICDLNYRERQSRTSQPNSWFDLNTARLLVGFSIFQVRICQITCAMGPSNKSTVKGLGAAIILANRINTSAPTKNHVFFIYYGQPGGSGRAVV